MKKGCERVILVNNQLGAQFFFRVCLFLFSTCFGLQRRILAGSRTYFAAI